MEGKWAWRYIWREGAVEGNGHMMNDGMRYDDEMLRH